MEDFISEDFKNLIRKMEELEHYVDKIEIKEYNTIIIGSGAAGLNCALHLVEEGISPNHLAIITEQLGGGTSFNAGSDKQTYYKMSLIGDQRDSPYDMAKDLCSGGAMHGDIALIEASNSIREFFHLIHLGVPFPQDQFGQFVGYKTDNDPRQRATSIGPLTSQKMSESLLNEVQTKKIAIYDKYYAFKILVDTSTKRKEAKGLICIKFDKLTSKKNLENIINSIRIFQARNIVLATGGPACLYKRSVYPKSQRGSMGLAILAGCRLQNLTESQFGLASIDFKWNVSGSYMQVIPRYVSIDSNGRENEFLNKHFPSFKILSNAIFLKGYQWPFNSERIENYGSSLIDLAVNYETEILGNKVYLDFIHNPLEYVENELDPLALDYLTKSNALAKTPIERLKQLNPQAIKLYKDHNIDISKEYLQIAVCNQHLNGGVSGDTWWETSIKHLFAIGEINGSHGVHRPGGAALNAGQVGGLRTAQKIGHNYGELKPINRDMFLNSIKPEIIEIYNEFKSAVNKKPLMNIEQFTSDQYWKRIKERMSKYGGIIRPLQNLFNQCKDLRHELYNLKMILSLKDNRDIIEYLRIKDALLTQKCILESILNYHELLGSSRGAYLILRDTLNDSLKERKILPAEELKIFNYIVSKNNLKDKIQTVKYEDDKFVFEWEQARGIPEEYGWFENVWKDYLNGTIFD
jgi:succinate dehydrogenase/fumarate reductase flavoprotein subunit